MSKTPMQELREVYPMFKFHNCSPVTQRMQLAKGDSIQVNPFATIEVPSNLVISLPNTSDLKTITPTTDDLIEVGLIKVREAVAAPIYAAKKPAPPSYGNKAQKPVTK